MAGTALAATEYPKAVGHSVAGVTKRAVPHTELLGLEFDGRLVGHVVVDAAGERDEWEMHPNADEFLYLVEGAIDVILRDDLDRPEEGCIQLRAGSACVVSKGAWHRQIVVAPCKMLFMTPETLHRPYEPDDGWS